MTIGEVHAAGEGGFPVDHQQLAVASEVQGGSTDDAAPREGHQQLTLFSNDPLEPEVTVILLANSTRCFATTAAYGSPMQQPCSRCRTSTSI